MQTINITAHTEDASQIEVIKSVMIALKIKFEIIEKPYNPEFVTMVMEAEEEIKKGKSIKVSSKGFDELWK